MIRAYTHEDWNDVCRVFDAAKPVELATAGIARSFVPLASDEKRVAEFSRATVFVECDGSQARGFIGFAGSNLGWLFVHPDHFRLGIGRQLLRHALLQMPASPWLWVAKRNAAAIPLYRSEGFEIVEERETQNRGWSCTAVKMVWKHNPPNKAPEPTPTAVTSPANAGAAPAAGVAHL